MAETLLRLYRCAAGGPDWAPLSCACASCGSVEAYLRLANVPYVAEPCASREASPTGALPALLFDGEAASAAELGADGDEAAAAAAAATYAAQQGFDLDVRLVPTQRADAAAFRALIQERIAPALLYYAWLVPENFAAFTRPAYGASLPTGVARWMTWRWQQGVAAQLARAPLPPTQARERLSADAAAALAALAVRLESAPAGGPYFFGAEASSLDAFALAHLAFIAHSPTAEGPLRAALKRHPSLVAYVQRGMEGPLAPTAAAAAAAASGGASAPRAAPAARRRAAAAAAAAAGGSDDAAASAERKRSAKERRFKRRTQMSIAFALASVVAYVLLTEIDLSVDLGVLEDDEAAADTEQAAYEE